MTSYHKTAQEGKKAEKVTPFLDVRVKKATRGKVRKKGSQWKVGVLQGVVRMAVALVLVVFLLPLLLPLLHGVVHSFYYYEDDEEDGVRLLDDFLLDPPPRPPPLPRMRSARNVQDLQNAWRYVVDMDTRLLMVSLHAAWWGKKGPHLEWKDAKKKPPETLPVRGLFLRYGSIRLLRVEVNAPPSREEEVEEDAPLWW